MSIPHSGSPRADAVSFVQSFEEIAERYDLLLCDVWGVLHDGLKAFPAAGEALTRFREAGGRVVLVSNAPRPGDVVTRQLDQFGVPRTAYDDVRTSGDLTRAIVAGHGEKTFHHIGPERDLGLFRGLSGRPTSLAEAEYVVCTGLFDDETETAEHYAETLAAMRERDLPMICANPDLVVERGHQLIVCAGAIAAAYEDLGGRTVTPGKPHRPIYEAALALGSELLGRPVERSRVLGVGDAIRTDVAGGHGAGVHTMLVARGIHASELGAAHDRIDPDFAVRWAAGQDVSPTYVIHDLTWRRTQAS
ncbi:TIGR01459 family HAD-type hydrolase [Enterovirga rhinocerotis]|uniref:HAD superfamily hydrolase (TIGR01459 family) n=1 Tax=Enterovirga rhinocerotis TaxID=1339210 RepID=A0A4V3DXD2_9HYPH|nr:TIGR01459 family HAD-type hydrolase [Enterovirga rhinocerotis]TDR88019.1 HAD superfamily hydrolase (TIGR01459 family) [Enterovirga rhinocerotis]